MVGYFYNFFVKLNSLQFKVIYLLLFIIHLSSFYFNYKINLESQFDSYYFYLRALNVDSILVLLRPGTRFISFLIYPLVKLNIGYFTLSLLFANVSLIGILKIVKLFLPLDTKLKKIGVCFMFLPSLHFWTSGVTKEALIIFFMALILQQIAKSKTLSVVTIVSLIFILFIRPYLFIFLLLALTIKFLAFNKITLKKWIKGIASFILLILVSLPIFKYFLKIKTFSISEIENVFNKLNIYSLSTGNSSIGLETTSYFDRVLIVMFRPFFFDATNFYQYVVSIENFCFIFFSLIIIYSAIKTKITFSNLSFYLILSSFFIILFLSTYMYNLGLASRMRVMFIPFLTLGMVLLFNAKKTSLHEA